MTDIDESKFSALCRICLLNKELSFISLDVLKSIEECINVQISLDDGLPNSICHDCKEFIDKILLFKRMCQNSNKILYDIIKNKRCDKVQIENSENVSINNKADRNQTSTNLRTNRILSNKLTCQNCNKKFLNASTLSKHMQKHEILKQEDPETKHDKSFQSVLQLQKHQGIHAPSLPCVCTTCGKSFISKSKLRRHELIHSTRLRIHACSHCDKAFHDKDTLRGHVRLCHATEPRTRYVCPICGVSVIDLRSHTRRRHSSNQRLKCEICSTTFRSNSDLTRHTRNKHSNNPTTLRALCSTCGKPCASLAELRQHSLTHTGAKPHACHLCDKRYTAAKTLRCHLRTHSGDKPFACTVCDRRFHNSQVLKHHTRIHSGVRPFVCQLCGKTFAQSAALYNHKKTH